MIYVFHGQDEFTADEGVRGLREAVGQADLREANTSVFAGEGLRMAEMLAAAATVPFLADRRLVLVNGLLARLDERGSDGGKDWLGLADALAALPPTTDVVFIESSRLRTNGTAMRLVGADAEVRLFDVPRRERLQAWIRERCSEKGSQFEPEAVARLAWLVGANLRLVDHEIEKLALFAGDREVTRADVDALVSNARAESVFAAIDAVLERRPGVATRALYALLLSGTQVATIISLLARQTRLVMLARHLLDSGVRAQEEIGDRVGLRQGFALDKTLRQAARFDTAYLADVHRRLLEADLSGKTGRMDERLSLELLVARLSGAASSNRR